jgi:hypothetical protein
VLLCLDDQKEKGKKDGYKKLLFIYVFYICLIEVRLVVLDGNL